MKLGTDHILETEDERFYATELFGYHWPLYGLSSMAVEKFPENRLLRTALRYFEFRDGSLGMMKCRTLLFPDFRAAFPKNEGSFVDT